MEGSGRHRRKGMLVARSDSISSGRRLFYGGSHGDSHNQPRLSYDKERLSVGASSKKRSSSRPSKSHCLPFQPRLRVDVVVVAGTVKLPANLGLNGEYSPGGSPVSSFPFGSLTGAGPGLANWSARGLQPPSVLTSRVALAVTEVQDWWREQLVSADASDDDSH